MKISLNSINPFRPETVGFSKTDSKVSAGAKESGNYDAITIQSSSRQIQEKTFSETLSRRITSEVKQETSPERVEALKQQVALGTYKIDPYAIASRMLMTGEAVAHA